MAGIDEDLIARAEKPNETKSASKKSKIGKRVLPISVCLIVAFAVAGFFTSDQGKKVFFGTDEISAEKTDDPDLTAHAENNSKGEINEIEPVTSNPDFSAENKTDTNTVTTPTDGVQDNGNNSAGTKGGDTSEELRDYRTGTDGGSYRVFKPETDVFEPLDNMTLENRFCSFCYNGLSYYPAPDGEITQNDYEPAKLASVKAEHWELRSAGPDDGTSGIIYYARIDIYKLKDVPPDEAVACIISFNGETKAYKYNATQTPTPSLPQ